METHTVGVRLPAKDAVTLRRVAENRGESMSSFVRRALYESLAQLGFVDQERRKALGLEPEAQP